MGYQGNKKSSLWCSFRYAFEGIWSAIRTERNIRIHICFVIGVVIASWYFQVSRLEWIILIMVMSTIIGLEMINTAIEAAVDIVTEEYHPLAKRAKDLAAGAVLLAAVASVIIGLIIFIPYLK